VAWLAAGAWLTALACVAFASRSLKRTRRFSCPALPEMVADAKSAARNTERELDVARAELADRVAEATRALSMAAFAPRGAARVSLASGTGFAVLELAVNVGVSASAGVVGASVAFVGGAAGAAAAASIGHRARRWAAEQRTLWVRTQRSAERALQRAD
jgi:hypothetical protein